MRVKEPLESLREMMLLYSTSRLVYLIEALAMIRSRRRLVASSRLKEALISALALPFISTLRSLGRSGLNSGRLRLADRLMLQRAFSN